jgi:hypothetical protein
MLTISDEMFLKEVIAENTALVHTVDFSTYELNTGFLAMLLRGVILFLCEFACL